MITAPPYRPPIAPTATKFGYYRWVICGLLLCGATINYIDRQVIGILKPTLTQTFQWNDERIYSSIIFAFSLAYAIGFMFAGRFVDVIGTRRGFAIAVILWSVAAVAHGIGKTPEPPIGLRVAQAEHEFSDRPLGIRPSL